MFTTKKDFKKYTLLSLISLGTALTVLGIYFLGYERTVLSFDTTPEIVRTPQYINSLPVRIVIPSLKIDLPVSEGKIFSGVWQISGTGASHLNISGIPGGGGNIIMYGHNLKRLFGLLPSIRVGDNIDVISKDGRFHSYIVTKTDTVKPDNTDYIAPKNFEVLTIYTCTGFLDSMRFMVQAVPVKAGSSS
jgi:LPXTG-site transpeptidase (sortase) family protein